mgnify:CR=1 FL=1
MRFSFVILTWNRKAFLERCISSLIESVSYFSDAEIIVMDNGSTDGTAEYLAEFYGDPRFRVFRLKRNYGLRSYKKLLRKAKGDLVVVVDDDVLAFPPDLNGLFSNYIAAFPDFGYLALDVIQNEFTNGAKPPDDHYRDVVNGDLTIQLGPTGGWCTCFRRRDFRKIQVFFEMSKINMKVSEDGLLAGLFLRWCGLKSGIIKGHRCFHATGPHYSKEHGFLERDIEKYKGSGLDELADLYISHK